MKWCIDSTIAQIHNNNNDSLRPIIRCNHQVNNNSNSSNNKYIHRTAVVDKRRRRKKKSMISGSNDWTTYTMYIPTRIIMISLLLQQLLLPPLLLVAFKDGSPLLVLLYNILLVPRDIEQSRSIRHYTGGRVEAFTIHNKIHHHSTIDHHELYHIRNKIRSRNRDSFISRMRQQEHDTGNEQMQLVTSTYECNNTSFLFTSSSLPSSSSSSLSSKLYTINIPKIRQQLLHLSSSTSSSVVSDENTQSRDVVMSLVKMGMLQQQQQQQQQKLKSGQTTYKSSTGTNQNIISFPQPQRVQGCISTVYIQTSIMSRNTEHEYDSNKYYYHSIFDHSYNIDSNNNGITSTMTTKADSYISRGFLYCIEQLFHSISVYDILSLQTSDISSIIHYLFTPTLTSFNYTNSMSSPETQSLSSTLFFLSKSRNDGFNNMIKLIQEQIRTILKHEQQTQLLTQPIGNGKGPSSVSLMERQEIQFPRLNNHFLEATLPTASIDRYADENLHDTVSTSSTVMTTDSIYDSNVNITMINVALLLSGGVDSTVALNMLVRGHCDTGGWYHPQGESKVHYNVTAFYLKIWLEDELSNLNSCPWEDDIIYCQKVCQQLSDVMNRTVGFHTISLQEEYNQYILQYTINEAKLGRTPNPDIVCNQRIKFGCFYQYIFHHSRQHFGSHFDFIATGHYAQILRPNKNTNDEVVQLHRAPDPVKDQSYFLCALSQEQIKKIIFPIGHLTKHDVRRYADQYELPNRYRPDSQGLCFLGKVKFDTFLNNYIPDSPGPIIDAMTSNVIGYHRGLWYHTIGQRKGLGKVLFANATSNGPWYVLRKDTTSNTIYCTNSYEEEQYTSIRSEFAVEAIHWIAGVPPLSSLVSQQQLAIQSQSSANTTRMTFELTMKIRHGPNLVQGYLSIENNDITPDNNNCPDKIGYSNNDQYIYESNYLSSKTKISTKGYIRLANNSKDSGLAPGQYVAFYSNCPNNTECYGSAVICENESNIISALSKI